MKNREKVTEYLKRQIILSGYKKSYIAKQMNISHTYLSMLLSGKRKSAKTISRLVGLLDDIIKNQKQIKSKGQ